MATPARKLESQVVHCLRKRVAFNDPGIASGIEIGVVPAGSFVSGVTAKIETAFNAGTNNNLSVGIAGTVEGFATAANMAAGTAGMKAGLTGTLSGNVANDTSVRAFYSQSGAAASAGVADILVFFYPHAS